MQPNQKDQDFSKDMLNLREWNCYPVAKSTTVQNRMDTSSTPEK